MSKSITISIRVKPEHLAKALDGLEQYDKSFLPESLASIIRHTFFHGINYLSVALPHEPSQRSLDIITSMTKQPTKRRNVIKDPSDLLREQHPPEQRPLSQEETIQIELNKMTRAEKGSYGNNFNPAELLKGEQS